MTLRHLRDPKTPIGDVLEAAEIGGVLLESSDRKRFAVLPLDDDLIDYLLERDPRFIDECRRIREEMRSGRFHSHDEVKQILSEDPE